MKCQHCPSQDFWKPHKVQAQKMEGGKSQTETHLEKLDSEDMWRIGLGIKVKPRRAVTSEVSKLGLLSPQCNPS